MPPADLITVRDDGAEWVISLSHRHINERAAAEEIAGRVGELIDQSDCSNHDVLETLNLDLQLVDRLTSVALNHLIGINRHARNRGIRLVLTNVHQSVRDVFALTRLERMFELTAPDNG